jgi:hypothetical protein
MEWFALQRWFGLMTKRGSLQEFVDRHRRPFVLTGAGCSTRSGIPDYRDADGPWKRAQPVTYQAFMGDEKTPAAIDRAASSAGGAFVGPGQTTRIELWHGSRRWAGASFFDPELRNLRLQPKSAFSRFAPVRMRNLEGSKGSISPVPRAAPNERYLHTSRSLDGQ